MRSIYQIRLQESSGKSEENLETLCRYFDKKIPREKKPKKIAKSVPMCGRAACCHLEKKVIWRYRCQRRNCKNPKCRKDFSDKRAKAISEEAALNGLDWFMTLTLDPKKFASKADAWQQISHLWLKLRKRLLRREPSVGFIAIIAEQPGTGFPHIHAVLTREIDADGNSVWGKQWLMKNWQECGGGFECDLGRIEGDVAKYMTSQAVVARYMSDGNNVETSQLAPRQRSIWRSSNLAKPPVKESDHLVFILKGHRPFDRDGLIWTQAELEAVMENEVGKQDIYVKGVRYGCTEKRSGKDLGATCWRCHEGYHSGKQEIMEADSRRAESNEASQDPASTKEGDQREDQEVRRTVESKVLQLAFEFITEEKYIWQLNESTG